MKKNSLIRKLLVKQGEMAKQERHHPTNTKEWFNSIYLYNKSTSKLLPSIDVSVIKIVRRYFYMFSKNLEKKIRAPRLRLWMRKYKTGRILVAKPEFKHTNDKVVITLYVYNRDLYKNIRKMNNIRTLTNMGISAAKKDYFVQKLSKLNALVKNTFPSLNKQKDLFFKFLNKQSMLDLKNTVLLKLVKKLLKRERLLLNFKRMIHFNNSKFNSVHLLPLKNFMDKVYNKEVEFNIVSLKSFHLNGDILLQILATKLKNRKNRVISMIESSFRGIKIPFRTRLEYFAELPVASSMQNRLIRNYVSKNYLYKVPTVKSLTINTLYYKNVFFKKVINDKLDMMLKSLFPKQYAIAKMPYLNKEIDSIKAIPFKHREIENTVLDSIRHKTVSGIRIEASGRLTRRLIASRAIFKMKQIGTVKNINSSYKGHSSVMLRGNFKSNVQISKIKNKTRIGSFGLKSWISSV